MNEAYTIGSLYLAGFAQAQAPHIGLMIPTSSSSGTLVHIRIDRDTSPNWARQVRIQKIEGDMFLTSLLKIGGPIAPEALFEASKEVPVPENDEFGECLPWAMALVEKLDKQGLIRVQSIEELVTELEAFVNGNRAYARRNMCPNVAVSSCSS